MRRAVVAGGSVAGLLAARVLHDLADEVLVVEPGDLPEGPEHRAAVPQDAQLHILLGLGQHLLAHWFPGILDDLAADGAVLRDPHTDARMYVDGRMRPPVGGDSLLPVDRPLLEWHIRSAVLALPRVRLVRDRVVGLELTGDRVTGARLESGVRRADLVVDATGRAARLSSWLADLGYPAAPKRRIGLDLGYATTLFRRRPGARLDGMLIVHSTRSAAWARAGMSCVAPVGPDRWVCVVSGYGADRPTRDPRAFAARCLAEPAPGFAELVGGSEAVAPVATHRFPHSVRRDFHAAERFPDGVVPVGDAVASFNPIYGQGISSAALHASALGGWLGAGTAVGDYLHRLSLLVDVAWQTVLNDFRLPHVTGERPRGDRFRQALAGAIDAAAMSDPVVARRFADVLAMRARPVELLRPAVLGRVVVAAARTRFAANHGGDPPA
ncbi:hypothetical protein [Actinokineospora sp. NBRC 105648]|uniref:hypothetical protein n=1 Tax=Actinokineospora sp. NBRC 105648 TaxID=3032206 RepID=UPI0024A48986|nr:hypothetical protein [Actinokineospora sp. NBRC 105648]GLZ36434.1 FAD-binding monooxygenase [Actinokineospora sp. NBRC 105648]